MKYFSLFTGIGGFEKGIQQAYENLQNIYNSTKQQSETKSAGSKNRLDTYSSSRLGNPICIGYSEIDKYAIQIYQKHFPNHKNYGDITTINAGELPDFDFLCGGFPCQSFSIAGKRGGFEDTRGTLFFDIARILQAKKPRLFLLENVKGLLSHDNGRTFKTIISTLTELGYDLQWQVLNSKNFGVPQNRERVFIVGHIRGTARPQVFPFGGSDQEDTRIIGQDVSYALDATYAKGTNTLSKSRRQLLYADAKEKRPNQKMSSLQRNNEAREVQQRGVTGNIAFSETDLLRKRMYESGVQSETEKREPELDDGALSRKEHQAENRNLRSLQEKKENRSTPSQRELEGQPNRELARDLPWMSHKATSNRSEKNGLQETQAQQNWAIRRLTPLEAERLQGFPDGWTEGVSDTQRYKTLGNAVTVNVVQAIMEKLLK